MAFGGNFLHNLNIGMQLRWPPQKTLIHLDLCLNADALVSVAFSLNSFSPRVLVRRCYEMERRLKTPDLFKFPYFEAICWYVAKNMLEMLKGERQMFVKLVMA